MNCEQVFERLSDFLDDELPAAERVAFAAHVDSCTRCSQFGSEFGAVVAALRAAAKPKLPQRVADALRLPDE